MGIFDGDTIEVVFADPPPGIQKEESIRLLGINTPELNARDPESFAQEAQQFVAEQTADSVVYLAFDSKWRGSFGRLLAYVFNSQGLLLNAELLSSGLATLYSGEPCHFHQYFVTLEVAARTESKGMWTAPIDAEVVIRQIFNDGRTEYVELWNCSTGEINLSGWYLLDERQNRIDIPLSTSIQAKELFYVLSGADTPPPSANSVYPTEKSIWNNDGDKARLYDDDDVLVTEYEY